MDLTYKNLHELFRNSAYKIHRPDDTYLLIKDKAGNYKPQTYREFENQLNAVSACLLSWGFVKGDRIAFYTDNCPEYLSLDQGMQQLGIVNASVYSTLSEHEASFIINDSGAEAIFVGSNFLLKKLLKVLPELPQIRKIITVFENDTVKGIADDRIIGWNEMMVEGTALYAGLRDQIEQIYNTVTQDDLACLIYTSGTTGSPKGAMLTHGNFISDCRSGLKLMSGFDYNERFLSFLPLCHVYERMVGYYLGLYKGAQVAFAESIEKISKNIGEAQPTIIATVPRLLEKIEERVKKTIEKEGGIKLKMFRWAMNQGEQRRRLALEGKAPGVFLRMKLSIAEKLVFHKIKQRLGGRIKFIVSGGAAMPVHVAEFFAAIGIRVLEGYGLTETSPFISVNEYDRQIIGTVGRVGPEQEVAIQNIETGEMITIQTYESMRPDFECAEGEILMRGPNLMKGYWNQPEETKQVIDSEGWFHTGDIGKFYLGNLKITDRLKNILVNAYGKNIYPTLVENTYLISRKIEQIFIIGDKRDYLTAIIVPAQDELREHFSMEANYFNDPNLWIEEKEVRDWLAADVTKFGNQLAKFERIRDFVVKRHAFSVETGEMTPKQSIKRKVVEKNYAETVNAMYARNTQED